jgi:hypothetical protein
MNPELFTVCATAKADKAPRVRPLCLDWIKAIHPNTSQTVDEMLPTPLSPTGALPATDYLCCLTLTKADAEHMVRFVSEHGGFVVVHIVGPQQDTPAARLSNRDRFLVERGLKVAV